MSPLNEEGLTSQQVSQLHGLQFGLDSEQSGVDDCDDEDGKDGKKDSSDDEEQKFSLQDHEMVLTCPTSTC